MNTEKAAANASANIDREHSTKSSLEVPNTLGIPIAILKGAV